MTFVKYDIYFHELAKQAISILTSEYERARCFVRGLTLSIHMSTQSLVAAGRSFVQISDHAQLIKEMPHEIHEGRGKRPSF